MASIVDDEVVRAVLGLGRVRDLVEHFVIAEEAVGHLLVSDLQDLSRVESERGVFENGLLLILETLPLALSEVAEPVELERADDLDFRLGAEVPPPR